MNFYFYFIYFLVGYYEDVRKRREFFDVFARNKGFDPHIAENWYTISRDDVFQSEVLWIYFCITQKKKKKKKRKERKKKREKDRESEIEKVALLLFLRESVNK